MRVPLGQCKPLTFEDPRSVAQLERYLRWMHAIRVRMLAYAEDGVW